MRSVIKYSSNRHGFTLMEVIVTIIAAGILAAFFVHFMGTALSRASNSVERVRAESGGEATVERIVADYVAVMNGNNPGTALNTIATSIDGNTYDDSFSDITVTYEYISFNSGSEVIEVVPTTTMKITVTVAGNAQFFMLGQSRTAADQPLVRY